MRALRVEQWTAALCIVVCWGWLGESAPQDAAAAASLVETAVIAKQDAKATLKFVAVKEATRASKRKAEAQLAADAALASTDAVW